MNNFFSTVLNSPTVSTSRAIILYLIENAASSDMSRFYLYVAMGLLGALLVQRLALHVVRRLLRKSEPDVVERVAGALRMPLGLLTFSYFFLIGFDAIKSMPHELWMHVHSDLYPILNGLLILICSFRLVDIISQILRKRWQSEAVQLDERWADLLGIVGKGIVSLGAGLFIIQKIDPTFNIVPLLTGISFVGAAVALASQNTIANAIGSMEIMVDRLFKEGDRISFGAYDGFVVRMGLRSITLASLTGEKINLPNKDLVDKQIRNFTRGKFVIASFAVSIPYDNTRAKIERATALMEKVIGTHPKVEKCEASLRRLGENAIELQAWYLADFKTGSEYTKILSDIQLAIKEAFDEAGIAFAFPSQTFLLKQEPAAK